MENNCLQLNLNGRLTALSEPLIMGIVNVTPDSFYATSRVEDEQRLLSHVRRMLDEGVDILDVGACSTRPGGEPASEAEELRRLSAALPAIRAHFPGLPLSVDTFRSSVARYCVQQHGVSMVNDISAGTLDDALFPLMGELRVPYVLTHCRPHGTEQGGAGEEFVGEVIAFLAQRVERLRALGVNDIVIDPGFGFGKTIEQNYRLMQSLAELHLLGLPLLVGVSRKSMICRPLGITPEQALNGTTVLNTVALMQGAHILRVHDVKEAIEAKKIVKMIKAL